VDRALCGAKCARRRDSQGGGEALGRDRCVGALPDCSSGSLCSRRGWCKFPSGRSATCEPRPPDAGQHESTTGPTASAAATTTTARWCAPSADAATTASGGDADPACGPEWSGQHPTATAGSGWPERISSAAARRACAWSGSRDAHAHDGRPTAAAWCSYAGTRATEVLSGVETPISPSFPSLAPQQNICTDSANNPRPQRPARSRTLPFATPHYLLRANLLSDTTNADDLAFLPPLLLRWTICTSTNALSPFSALGDPLSCLFCFGP